jgi:hypothetical protein
VSLILPLWGIVLIVLGVKDGSLWWIASGVAIGAAGAVTFIGSPLMDFVAGSRRREARPGLSTPEPCLPFPPLFHQHSRRRSDVAAGPIQTGKFEALRTPGVVAFPTISI